MRLLVIILSLLVVQLTHAAGTIQTNGIFGGLLLGGTTNIISDNGTTLTRNGSAISGGGGIVGTVSNSVAQSGLLAVDATKTNGIAATFAHVTNALGYLPMTNSFLAVTNALGYLPATNSALGNYVLKAGDTMSGTLVAPAAQVSDLLIGAMAVNRGTLTHAGGNVIMDMSLTNRYWSCTLTGNVQFVLTNVSAGKWCNVLLTMPATNCTPLWPVASTGITNWFGGAPSTLTGGAIGTLSFYAVDSTTNSTKAAYAETQ